MGKLTNKVAIVTGAGQGVGQGIAFALAAEGARVAVLGRTLEKVQATAQEIQARGGEAMALQCDVKESIHLSDSVARVATAYGGIQILVNNAQEMPLGTLLDVSDDDFATCLASGPVATYRMMKMCYPFLKGDGCIINLATTAAKRWDTTTFGPYSAAKEAIRSLTHTAACEWGPDGIRANVILPLASSPGLQQWIESHPKEAKMFLSTVPMRRVGDCENDIGRFVATLCSDDCSYISGQSIAVDGGQAYMG
ncbi:MAG: 3-oxoacyl-ACP reductase [Gammaproteobacteria bacterium]|nr:MAG: 3-oxoacyl-ACP reductase [Gammaproteobacteria bacterium]